MPKMVKAEAGIADRLSSLIKPYKDLYGEHDKAIPAALATVATVLSGGVSTVNGQGEPFGAFVMIGLSCVFATLAAVTWGGIKKHSPLTRTIRVLGLGCFFLWSVIWAVITWRNKPKDKWTNFTWDDLETFQSYMTAGVMISWRWLLVVTGIICAFLIGRLAARRSELRKKSDIGLIAHGTAEPNKSEPSFLQCAAIRHDKVSVGNKGGWVRSGRNPVDAFTLTIRNTSEYILYPLVARIAFYGTDGHFCHQVNNAEWLEAGKSRRVLLGVGEIKEILLLWKLSDKDVYASGDTNRADLCSCGDVIRAVVAFVAGNEETFIQQLELQITFDPLTVKQVPQTSPQNAARDERLRRLLEHDKESIKSLVRIPGIAYQPCFDPEGPYLDFVISVFNGSLFDVVVKNTIGTSYIFNNTDSKKFHYPARIESDEPIPVGSRCDNFFVLRQPLRLEEISAFQAKNKVLSFGTLEIKFTGEEIGETRLDTQNHLVETQKGGWRAWDQIGFICSYSDERWALLSSSNQQEVASLRAERDSLKSQLELVESKNAEPNFVFLRTESVTVYFDDNGRLTKWKSIPRSVPWKIAHPRFTVIVAFYHNQPITGHKPISAKGVSARLEFKLPDKPEIVPRAQWFPANTFTCDFAYNDEHGFVLAAVARGNNGITTLHNGEFSDLGVSEVTISIQLISEASGMIKDAGRFELIHIPEPNLDITVLRLD